MNYELIRTAVRNALCACFGLQPDSDQALSFIRRSYEEPEVNPVPARSTDAVYWDVSPDYGADPASYNTIATVTGSNKASVQRFLPYQLTVVCYGPCCEANARIIRSAIYFDGNNQPRSILRKVSVYPVPDPPPVSRLFEPEGSLWRCRADVVIPLRVLDTFTAPTARNSIQTAPAIILHK